MRLRSFILNFMLQLGIRLHGCLTPKRILNSYPKLSRDVYHRLKIDLGDQAHKRKTCRMIISHLKHYVEDVLAHSEGHPHNQSIHKTSHLQYKLTPTSCGLEIVQNNLQVQPMRGREGTDLDMSMCSLIALWMSIKEIPKLLEARRLQNLCKRIG
jgi:hypothetical protein